MRLRLRYAAKTTLTLACNMRNGDDMPRDTDPLQAFRSRAMYAHCSSLSNTQQTLENVSAGLQIVSSTGGSLNMLVYTGTWAPNSKTVQVPMVTPAKSKQQSNSKSQAQLHRQNIPATRHSRYASTYTYQAGVHLRRTACYAAKPLP